MATCNKTGCHNRPTHELCLALRPANNIQPALSTPLLFLCDDHKDEISFEDLTPPDGWRRICEGFIAGGYEEPKKEFSFLVIQPIASLSIKKSENLN
jgi:hypothetical protein